MPWNIEPLRIPCVFCADKARWNRLVVACQNVDAYARFDEFPVTQGHILVIPKRHVNSWFELTDTEVMACNELLRETKDILLESDLEIEGFNVGWNTGKCAGQTIEHCHIHMIPRREGDSDNPIGGIRKCVDGNGEY